MYNQDQPRDSRGRWGTGELSLRAQQASKDSGQSPVLNRVASRAHAAAAVEAANNQEDGPVLAHSAAAVQHSLNAIVAGHPVTNAEAIKDVDTMEASREWGKLPTKELFDRVVESQEAVDRFGSAAAAAGAVGFGPVGNQGRVEDLPLGSLTATQRSVRTDSIKDIIANGAAQPYGSREQYGFRAKESTMPTIVRSEGVNYIMDGHHRIVAEMFKGTTRMKMRVIDA